MKTFATDSAVSKLMNSRMEKTSAIWTLLWAQKLTARQLMPNENSKPVIHRTSTMKAVLKLIKFQDPPLQNHYLCTQVHRSIAAENLCHRRLIKKNMAWNLTLMKILMRTMKLIARVLEIIHCTFNVRRKKYTWLKHLQQWYIFYI